jgi:hypothetical protein
MYSLGTQRGKCLGLRFCEELMRKTAKEKRVKTEKREEREEITERREKSEEMR